MAKKTLLQLVQNILSDMDSDEVNSISDTVESLQVAEILRAAYEDLVATLDIPERRALVKLEALGDVNKPNYLKIPDEVKFVNWMRYRGSEITYKTPEAFINYVLDGPGEFEVTDFRGINYFIESDRDPEFWTCFDDEYLVFSSFNADVESTLQEVNSLAYANITTLFQLEDTYIADLDDNLYPLWLSEAKSTAFISLKQVSNSKEDQKARRSLVRAQNELSRTSSSRPADRLPNYGRRR